MCALRLARCACPERGLLGAAEGPAGAAPWGPAGAPCAPGEVLKAVPVGSPPVEQEGVARECLVCLNEARGLAPCSAGLIKLGQRSVPARGRGGARWRTRRGALLLSLTDLQQWKCGCAFNEGAQVHGTSAQAAYERQARDLAKEEPAGFMSPHWSGSCSTLSVSCVCCVAQV